MPGISRRGYEISVQDHRLQYLSLSARHGSMRAAADFLGVAASSISRQIKLLERALSIDLIVKGSYKVQLTEAGQLLIEYYERRVHEHHELMARLSELRSTRTSTLRIVVAQGFLAALFLDAFASVSGQFPDINIELKVADGEEAVQLLLTDGALIGVLFDTAGAAKLKVLASVPQPISLLVPPHHELASATIVSPAQIARERLVLPDAASRVVEIVQAAFAQRELPLNIVMKSPSIPVILSAVERGIGVALLPQVMARAPGDPSPVVAKPIDCDELTDIRLYLVARAGRRMTPAALALQNALLRAVRRLADDR